MSAAWCAVCGEPMRWSGDTPSVRGVESTERLVCANGHEAGYRIVEPGITVCRGGTLTTPKRAKQLRDRLPDVKLASLRLGT